jgi:hypothetical protein
MNNLEELEYLFKLQAFLDAAKQIVQGEGIVGGHRGVVDDCLTTCCNEVYDRIEALRNVSNQ